MTTIKEEAYFFVRDKHGDDYLCPLNLVSNKETLTSEELANCVEKDVVERYSGNIDIEP